MVTILHEQQQHEVEPVAGPTEGLWLEARDLERTTGFALKPEGLCRDAICVPVPKGDGSFVHGSAVDVAGFWRHIGHPVAHDSSAKVWVLGIGAAARRQTLETLEAPDFKLPDIDGRMHSLSEHRGKKVFLATWASW